MTCLGPLSFAAFVAKYGWISGDLRIPDDSSTICMTIRLGFVKGSWHSFELWLQNCAVVDEFDQLDPV